MGSKSWLRTWTGCWATSRRCTHPSSVPESWSTTLRARACGADTFEPVVNLHRCYLRRDSVFLRSLARLAGRDVDRHFYFRRLLPGALRCRAGGAPGRLGAAGTKPPNPHSPPRPCYKCYMCYISQGKPLNIHSPRVLAICAICATWPYIAHILQIFARTEYIAHIVHIARSWGRVGVQRLGV